MKITKVVNAPVGYIFLKIVESAQFDIHHSTGERVPMLRLKGYSYTKQFNEHRSGKITILDVVENETYSFETKTTKNDFTTTYSLKAISDEETEVIVDEEMKSYGFFQQANDFVLSLLLGKLKKKQITAMLESMGKAYQAS